MTAPQEPQGLDRYRADVRRVDKPWGHELIYAVTDRYCGKVLFVRAGETLSLQYHRRKDETIYLFAGRAHVEIGEQGEPPGDEELGPGASFRIMPGVVHRLRAVEDTHFLEVSTPDLDDVVRLEDRYGRSDL